MSPGRLLLLALLLAAVFVILVALLVPERLG